jgi:hypothetical protein
VELQWLNPEAVTQVDLVFARGSVVYRVIDVPAQQPDRGSPLGPERRRDAAAVLRRLACGVREAGCGA